jgi:hypothetical protein
MSWSFNEKRMALLQQPLLNDAHRERGKQKESVFSSSSFEGTEREREEKTKPRDFRATSSLPPRFRKKERRVKELFCWIKTKMFCQFLSQFAGSGAFAGVSKGTFHHSILTPIQGK